MTATEPKWCDGDHLPEEGHHAPPAVLHGVILARSDDEDGPSIRVGTEQAIPDWDAILTPEQLIEFGRLAIRTGKAARRDARRGNRTRKLRHLSATPLSHWPAAPLQGR